MVELNSKNFFLLKIELNKRVDNGEIILDRLRWFVNLDKEEIKRLSGINVVEMDKVRLFSRYRALVDYNKTVKEMLDHVKCEHFESRIFSLFPVEGGGERHRDFEILHFKKPISFLEVKEKIKEIGLVDSSLIELLSFVYQYPSFQVDFPIVALGSERIINGHKMAVFIQEEGQEGPRLGLKLLEDDWDEWFRVLAVRK
ncbi:MAG: hypothetical protein WCO84_00695 [bacterium]